MAGNRKAAMKVLLDKLPVIDISGENVTYWKEQLTALNDAEFDEFIDALEREDVYISIVEPNYKGKKMTMQELIEACDKLGHKFEERVWLTDKETGITSLSVETYQIIDTSVRRQSQTLMNKMSVASHNNSIDTLSGQVTGDSRSSRISFVEMQLLNNQGCDRTIEEFAKPRGGDNKALAVLDKQIIDTGKGSLDAPGMDTGSVKSVDVLAAIFRSIHLENTFDKRG